jgi:hypothetical protein
MWFLVKDKRIPIADVVFVDNLSAYHNVISFTTVSKLYTSEGKIDIDSKKQYDVRILSQVKTQDNKIKVDCVTRKIYDAFNSITAGYTGFTNINSLFSKLGFSYESNCKSNNSYFCIGQYSVTSLFDELTKHASFANGGGAHFYMAQDGVVHGFDYKLIKEKAKATPFAGNIMSEEIDMNWTEYTPSEYEMFVYDNNNNLKREKLTLEKGFGKASVHLTDTTGIWKDVAKQELTNMFYNKWYNSHTVVVSIPMGLIPILGSLINLNNEGHTFIVKGVSVAYNDLQEVPSVSAVLISNPTFE